MTRLIALAVVLCAACATSPSSEPAVTESQEIARPPFSGAEIRDATHPFRTYVYRREEAGQPAKTYRMRFVDVDERGCRMEATFLDDEGQPLSEPMFSEATWEELVAHASYPKDATVIRDVEVEVPAGTFDAWLYTVTEDKDGAAVVTRAYFAKALPGAPVLHVVTRDGVEVSRLVLLAYDPGGVEERVPR